MQNRDSLTIIPILLATLALFTLSWLAISPLTFFVSDTALRFLQIQELVDQGWSTFAIEYGARHVDPDLQHVPYYYAYTIVEGQIYLSISPFFPLLASFLYAAFGVIGLPIIPVLGTLLAALATLRLVQLAALPHPQLAFYATIFATPLLFYSLQLWDHTLAVALAMWGVYGVARGAVAHRARPLLLGGLALGLAVGQRPEMYPFTIALVGGFLVVVRPGWRLLLPLVAGGLIGVLPLWILQYWWVGHPLGMATAPHLLGYGVPESYPVLADKAYVKSTRAQKLSQLLFGVSGRHPLSFVAMLLVLLGIAMIFLVLRVEKWRRLPHLMAALAPTVLGYLLVCVMSNQKLIIGIIPSLPLIPMGIVVLDVDGNRRPVQATIYRLVGLTALFFITLMVLFWPAGGGKQWGARYLMPLYPLFLYLALHVYTVYRQQVGVSLQRGLKITASALLVISILLQLLGVRTHFREITREARIRASVTALPANIILTNGPFLASGMSSVRDKTFIYVWDERELARMLGRLAQQEIDQVGVIPLQAIQLEVPDAVGDLAVVETSPFLYELVR